MCDHNIFSASLFFYPICPLNKYLGSICPDADVMQAVNFSLSFLLKSLQVWELQSQIIIKLFHKYFSTDPDKHLEWKAQGILTE